MSCEEACRCLGEHHAFNLTWSRIDICQAGKFQQGLYAGNAMFCVPRLEHEAAGFNCDVDQACGQAGNSDC